MIRLRWRQVLLLLGLLAVASLGIPVSTLEAQEERPAKKTDEPSGRRRWQQIVERDIFNPRPVERPRQRRSEKSPKGPARPDPTPPAPVKPQLLLTGVSLQDAKLYALFEHRSTGRVAFVAAGDTLSDHQIVEVAVGRVVVGSQAGEQQTLKLGDHLEIDDQTLKTSLEQIAASREDSPSASSNGRPSKASSGGGSAGSVDRKALLERLRQRRREQMQDVKQPDAQEDAQEDAQPDDQEESSDDAGSPD